MRFPQKTLRRAVEIEGFGLHSGVPVRVRFSPSSEGIAFRLGAVRVEARPENVGDTRRCTRLGPVATIEHAMSAFAALGITDLEVELDAPEMPALDGAGAAYWDAFEAVGLEVIGERTLGDPFARVFVKSDFTAIAVAHGAGDWRATFETGDRWPGTLTCEFLFGKYDYRAEIAPARTTAFLEEVDMARAAGLGLGLDETNCLVLGPEGYFNSAKFANEPARHKLLDLLGDLYLSGVPPQFLNVVAERSGHTHNVAAAAKLAAAVRVG
ncbi:MAG TPA: UDP-3-O-acyl-N-acetylglucosamine deacetylase [Fimbriimonadaceae bacterium]|nr:UDP-3-O-acyl-N-acetylglucosamine deacetylase [Fimbriimonadaceae bacterium]